MKIKHLAILLSLLMMMAVLTGCTQQEEVSTAASNYQNAIALLQEGNYSQASAAFAALGHYYDASRYSLYSKALASAQNGDYALAASSMQMLDGFMDSGILAVYYNARTCEEAESYEEALALYHHILQYGDAETRAKDLPAKMQERDYKAACTLELEGRYAEAIMAFQALNGYSDSDARIISMQAAMTEQANAKAYAEAEALYANEQPEEAISAFRMLGEYSDSAARAAAIEEEITEAAYQAALLCEHDGALKKAYAMYTELDHYKDAQVRAAALHDEAMYLSAYNEILCGQFENARKTYLELGMYKDSAEKARLLDICEMASETKWINTNIIAFKMEELWGYIDFKNNYDVAPAWNSISSFSSRSGLAVVTIARENSLYRTLINGEGKTVNSHLYLDIKEGDNGFYTAVKNGSRNMYDFVLLNAQGDEISTWRTLGSSHNTRPGSKYNDYSLQSPIFTNGVIIAADAEELYSLLNAQGEAVISGAEEIRLIDRKTACDTVLVKWGRSGWQLMALDGTVLDENKWAEVGAFANGYAAVRSSRDLWGYIRQEDCHVVIEPQYTAANDFSEDYAAVVINGFWGFIDAQNNIVIEPRYLTAKSFENGRCAVEDPDVGWQVIDKAGKLLYFKQNTYGYADELDQAGHYEAAIAAFESLDGYADSHERALQSREKINASVYASAVQLELQGNYIEAAETFEWLGEYSDASARAAAARETQNASVYAQAAAREKDGLLEDAISIYLTLGEYNGSAQRAADLRESINQGICNEAAALEADEQYESAIAVLNQIPEYKGVADHIASLEEKIRVREYNAAAALEEAGRFEEAISAFAAMGTYSDSAERIGVIQGKILAREYNAAAALEDAGRFEEAISAFAAMGAYSDSAERIGVIQGKILEREYNAAAALEEAGRFEEAIKAFVAMGTYGDSAERIGVIQGKILEREYNAAAALEEAGRFEEAISAFSAMGAYSDSAERVSMIQGKILEREYNAAAALEEKGKYTDAQQAFIALGEYADSAQRAAAVAEKAAEQQRKQAYTAAEHAEANGDLHAAAAGFKALGAYSDCPARLAAVEEKIRARDYGAAVEAYNKEDYAYAATLFGSLGNYKNSVLLLKQAQTGMQYQTALAAALDGSLSEAYNAFAALGDYKDSVRKAEIVGNLSRASKTRQIAEGVLIYDFHDLWGIANLNTNVITAAKYTSITYKPEQNYAKHGLLRVFLEGSDEPYNTYGYIDMNGQEIIPCSYFMVTDFNEDGNCTVAKWAGTVGRWDYYHKFLFGIMNHSGETITSAQWRTMGSSSNRRWNEHMYSFYDDYCQIQEPSFSKNRMKVQNADGKWGFIDKSGRILGSVKWYSADTFADGMAKVCEEITVGTGWNAKTVKKYGFINEQGQTIGEVRWDDVAPFSNGYAAVKENDRWGFINKQNQLVIPCRYSEVASFTADGHCDVKNPNGTWQVINTEGEVSFF